MNERFDELRRMGIRTVMITGDNRVTAGVIASEAGRRRLPGRGHARGQAGADPRRAGAGPHGRDDRRRHERRARAGSGRCRRGHEHGHVGREGGRQHGRPRLQSDQADRDRRGRQAAPDHARRADHVLDRQRRRQVLRDPAGDVRVHLRRQRPARAARRAQHHEPRHAEERDHERDHLQRADHPGARAARAARREVPRDRSDGAAAPQPAHLRRRRRDPAVRRHQADRPDRAQRASAPDTCAALPAHANGPVPLLPEWARACRVLRPVSARSSRKR